MKRLLMVVTLSVASLFIVPAQPVAAAVPVYVDDTGVRRWVWDTYYATGYVDQFTSSYRVMAGWCPSNARCIIIHEQYVRSDWAAVTYLNWPRYGVHTIYLNPYRANTSWATRRQILTHEVGHAYGITWHASYCSNGIMYWRLYCYSGYLPPYRFTEYQKQTLRWH